MQREWALRLLAVWRITYGPSAGTVRAVGKRHVVLIRSGSKLYDYDNLVGGAKMILDALVEIGLVAGDTPADVDVRYEQVVGPSGLTVEVEPATV
jgi:hypothetical protein